MVLDSYRFNHTMVLLITLTTIPQFYFLPLAGTHIPLNIIVSFGFIYAFFLGLRFPIWKPIFILSLLFLVNGIYLFFSVEEKIGILRLMAIGQFLVLFVGFTYFFRTGVRPSLTLKVISGFVIFQVFLVIVFRVFPSVEMSFLDSSLARVLISPNTLIGIQEEAVTRNVLSPEKAGGLFVNGNVGAGFLGVCAFLLFGLYQFEGGRYLLVASLLCVLGLLFSGSKAGVVIAFFLGVAGFVWTRTLKGQRVINLRSVAFLILGAFLIGLAIFLTIGGASVIQGFGWTGSTRLVLWYFGVQEFLSRPIFGHGFGGWEEAIVKYPGYNAWFDKPFPPHNNLLYVWSETGIFGLGLACLYILGSLINQLVLQ